MIVVVFLVLLTLLALYASPFVRKHNVKIYIIATIVSVLVYIMKDKAFAAPFIQGFLGLSFFYIVMMAGALPKKNQLRKKFMGIRREYSITGFIVVMPHAVLYILEWIDGTTPIEWFGFIAFVIMVPLFITSFQKIRKMMKFKNWRLLQSTAYIVYILLFIHLILNYTKTINLVLYLVMFTAYFALKGYYEYSKYMESRKKTVLKTAE